jgi:hypothetical protein
MQGGVIHKPKPDTLSLIIPYNIVRNAFISGAGDTIYDYRNHYQQGAGYHVRTRLGVDTGDRVEFVEIQEGVFQIMAATQSARQTGTVAASTRLPSIRRQQACRGLIYWINDRG